MSRYFIPILSSGLTPQSHLSLHSSIISHSSTRRKSLAQTVLLHRVSPQNLSLHLVRNPNTPPLLPLPSLFGQSSQRYSLHDHDNSQGFPVEAQREAALTSNPYSSIQALGPLSHSSFPAISPRHVKNAITDRFKTSTLERPSILKYLSVALPQTYELIPNFKG
uniref:Uncharacterized protein n=1 Tax=Knipowitschia caucasica TaxID=637954 RepID=A0AAV2LC44_KNICA